MSTPETVNEWEQYIESIPRSDIYDKAKAANSMQFVDLLKEEGYEAQAVDQILFFFARRLHDEEKFIPGSGATQYLNYRTLLQDYGMG